VRKEAKISDLCREMVRAAAAYIAQNSIKQAEIFFNEFENQIELIETMPGIGSKYENGMRRFLLGKFPYYIYYKENEIDIDILGIWHTSRGTKFKVQG
jgi:plasmid stabilization system protein ParE